MANNTLNFLSGFGEGFLKTLQSERERKQKEQEFNQRMAFETRQMNLLNNINMMQEKRLQGSEDREKEIQEYKIRSDYNEIAPEPNMPLLPFMMGGQGGGELNKPFDGVMNPFDPNKIYAPKTEQPKESSLTNFREGEDDFVYGWDGKEWVKTNLKTKSGESGNGNSRNGDGEDKEPKLTEGGAKGLANLKNPSFLKDNTYLTPEEVQTKFSENIQALTKDVLDSKTSQWFYDIVGRWGRIPTTEELDNEILTHYKTNKTLTVSDVSKLNRLVDYLEGAEDGINKYRNYPKFFKKQSEKKK